MKEIGKWEEGMTLRPQEQGPQELDPQDGPEILSFLLLPLLLLWMWPLLLSHNNSSRQITTMSMTDEAEQTVAMHLLLPLARTAMTNLPKFRQQVTAPADPLLLCEGTANALVLLFKQGIVTLVPNNATQTEAELR
jgi:hypothetical protein